MEHLSDVRTDCARPFKGPANEAKHFRAACEVCIKWKKWALTPLSA